MDRKTDNKKNKIDKKAERRAKKAKANNAIDMLHGSLWDKIIRFALPFMATSVLQQLFNATDTAVVGRFASSQAMAAVGSNASVIALIVGLFTGMAMGTNVVVARLIGQGRNGRIHDAVVTSMTTAILSGFLLIIVGTVVSRPLLTLMGTPENVIEHAVLYLRLFMLGTPFLMVYNFGSAVLRSKGDSTRPLYVLLASGVFNVLLNLLFVVVFRWGVAGVAIATDISNGVSAAIILWMLYREEERFQVSLRHLYLRKEPLMEILRVGVPAGLQGMVFSFSNIILQSAINSFGSDAVAGSAAAQNCEFVAYFVLNSFTQAAVTFTSQNFGAGDLKRCREVYRWCMLFGICSTLIVDVSFALLRYQILGLFATEPEVIRYGVIRLLTVCLFNFVANSYEITSGALRGVGYSILPTILTVIGSCLFRIAWVFTVFREVGTFRSLVIVYPISWAFTGAMVVIAYLVVLRKLRRQGQEMDPATTDIPMNK